MMHRLAGLGSHAEAREPVPREKKRLSGALTHYSSRKGRTKLTAKRLAASLFGNGASLAGYNGGGREGPGGGRPRVPWKTGNKSTIEAIMGVTGK